MITKQFAFFSFMLSFTILGRIIPIFDGIPLLILPLIYLVSGKKFVFYFITINTVINLNYIVPAILRLITMWPFIMRWINFILTLKSMTGNVVSQSQYIISVVNSSNLPQSIKNQIDNMFTKNVIPKNIPAHPICPCTVTPITYTMPVWFFPIDLALIAVLCYIVYWSGKYTYKKFRLYYDILKQVYNIAKHYHR